MTPISRVSILTVAMTVLAADAHAMKLRFLADLNVPTGTRFGETDLGGLSGLSFDARKGEYRVVSDDKGEKQPARFYTARLSLPNGRLRFEPLSVVSLRDRDGATFPKSRLDPEAIASFGDGRFLVSSEGDGRANPRIPPEILEFDRDGRMIGALPIPEKYLPEPNGEATRGVSDNAAFEGLSFAPNGRWLFAAIEGPLVQDDTPATFAKGALVRILRYKIRGKRRIPTAEYVYRTEPNARPDGATGDYGNGISEIVALGRKTLLVLERGTAATPKGVSNRVRIFKATLDGAATDVSGIVSLKGKSVRPAKKELVLDLDAILPEMSPERPSLDNAEAMAFGPKLPNGNRTLFLLSDNNFNPAQRTLVLAFEVLDE